MFRLKFGPRFYKNEIDRLKLFFSFKVLKTAHPFPFDQDLLVQLTIHSEGTIILCTLQGLLKHVTLRNLRRSWFSVKQNSDDTAVRLYNGIIVWRGAIQMLVCTPSFFLTVTGTCFEKKKWVSVQFKPSMQAEFNPTFENTTFFLSSQTFSF